MPEIAGPEWNFSGILRRFRRIRNSEDRFCSLSPSLPPLLLSGSPFLSVFREAVSDLTLRGCLWSQRGGWSALWEMLLASVYSFFLSLPLFFLSFFCTHRFLLHLPFSPFLFATRRLQAEIYKRERVFQGRANDSSSNGNNLDKDAPARKCV